MKIEKDMIQESPQEIGGRVKEYFTRKELAEHFRFSVSFLDHTLRKLQAIAQHERHQGTRIYFTKEVIAEIDRWAAENKGKPKQKTKRNRPKTSTQEMSPGSPLIPMGPYFYLYPLMPNFGFNMGQENVLPNTDEGKAYSDKDFARKDGKPIFANTLNCGNGVTPFDVRPNDQFGPTTGDGLSPFDIDK